MTDAAWQPACTINLELQLLLHNVCNMHNVCNKERQCPWAFYALDHCSMQASERHTRSMHGSYVPALSA